MTKDEAVSDISEAIRRMDEDGVEAVASVLYRAIDRANVRMIQAGRPSGGSGWRQGVIDWLHKHEFEQPHP